MQTFAMIMGIPGSGKDSFIKQNPILRNYTMVSSDEIRKEHNYEQGEIKNVFQIAREDIVTALQRGENVIFNATNLQRKHRMSLLEFLHIHFPEIRYEGYMILTPIKLCKEFNDLRTGFAKVPEKVIDNMVRAFQIPLEGEGFDKIFFCNPWRSRFCYPEGGLKYKYFSADYDEIYNFDQDNSHHSLTLGEHMDATYDYLMRYIEDTHEDIAAWTTILQAALWHDIGKMITKDYHDSKGNPTTEAHYYGHDNAGAYLVLTELPYFTNFLNQDFSVFVKMATYVNFHMRSRLVWAKFPDGKATRKDKKLLSDLDWKYINLLGEADFQAH